jgi:MFS family permease
MFKDLRDSPGLRTIFLGTAFNMVGLGLLSPVLPLYIQSFFGGTYLMVTWVPAVFGIGKWITNVPAGFLMEGVGRKRIMVGGLLLMALADLLSGLVDFYRWFLILRGLTGVGWALFVTASTAMVIDIAPEDRRGRYTGLIFLGEVIGVTLGASVGGYAYELLGGRFTFFLKSAASSASALVIWAFLPALSKSREMVPRMDPSIDLGKLKDILLDRRVIILFLTSFSLFLVRTGVYVPFYPIYLSQEAGLRPSVIGVLLSLVSGLTILTLYVGGELSDRFGRKGILVSGLALYGSGLILVIFTSELSKLSLISLVIGTSMGVTGSIPTASLGDIVPEKLRGRVVGFFREFTDTGMIIGPILMGALANGLGLKTPFILAGGILLLMSLTNIIFLPPHRF